MGVLARIEAQPVGRDAMFADISDPRNRRIEKQFSSPPHCIGPGRADGEQHPEQRDMEGQPGQMLGQAEILDLAPRVANAGATSQIAHHLPAKTRPRDGVIANQPNIGIFFRSGILVMFEMIGPIPIMRDVKRRIGEPVADNFIRPAAREKRMMRTIMADHHKTEHPSGNKNRAQHNRQRVGPDDGHRKRARQYHKIANQDRHCFGVGRPEQ